MNLKCPKCKSTNLLQLGVNASGGSNLVCLDCDWDNMAVIEDEPVNIEAFGIYMFHNNNYNREITVDRGGGWWLIRYIGNRPLNYGDVVFADEVEPLATANMLDYGVIGDGIDDDTLEMFVMRR